jgi:hypothetical protein
MHRAAIPAIASLALFACAGSTAATFVDQRGRRIVDIDRPVMATEFHSGRRVFKLEREATPDGPAGFTLGIEVADLTHDAPPNWETELVVPGSDVKLYFVVVGDAGRPFWSRDAQGNIRVRQFGDRTTLSVDLTFKGKTLDPALRLPIYTSKDDSDHVRIAGSFTASFDPGPN